jgi:hypothetical protein
MSGDSPPFPPFSSRGKPDLEVLCCVACGVTFGIDAEYTRLSLHELQGGVPFENEEDPAAPMKRDGTFCCPNGHEQSFVNKRSDIKKDRLVELARKLETAELRIVQLQRELTRVCPPGAVAKRAGRRRVMRKQTEQEK